MSKKMFINPYIKTFAIEEDTSGEQIGKGSGGSTPDISPYSYMMWLVIDEDFPEILDFDENGDTGTYEDYEKWCEYNNFEPRWDDFGG